MIGKIIKYILVYMLLLLGPVVVVVLAIVLNDHLAGGTMNSDDLWNMPYLIPAVVLGAVLIIIVFLWRRWAVLGLGHIRRNEVVKVVFLAVLVFISWFFIEYFLQGLIEVPDNMTDKEFELLTEGVAGFVYTAILAPIAEELLCRGAILGVMLKMMPRRPWIGIVVSAFIFGLLHMNPVQTVYGFFYGLLLGWLAWITGSLLPCIIIHLANNSFAMLLPETVDKEIADMSLTTEVMFSVICLLILLVVLRWFHATYRKRCRDNYFSSI